MLAILNKLSCMSAVLKTFYVQAILKHEITEFGHAGPESKQSLNWSKADIDSHIFNVVKKKNCQPA